MRASWLLPPSYLTVGLAEEVFVPSDKISTITTTAAAPEALMTVLVLGVGLDLLNV